MGITQNNGFFFSLDLAVTVVIGISMIFLIFAFHVNLIEERINVNKNFELWKNTVFVADSLVKNNYEEMPVLGSAVLDLEKKRVKSNEIDLKFLQNINSEQTKWLEKEFSVKKIALVFHDREKVLLEKKVDSASCIVVERTVLVMGETAKILVVGCNE